MSSAEAVASLSPTRAQSHDARCSMYTRCHNAAATAADTTGRHRQPGTKKHPIMTINETDYISGPGTAIGRVCGSVCVCAYRTKLDDFRPENFSRCFTLSVHRPLLKVKVIDLKVPRSHIKKLLLTC